MNLWLRVLFTPGLWLRNDPTSKEISAFIVSSLAQGFRPVPVNEHIMTLRGVPIWRANWPYTYGSLYGTGENTGIEDRLPSRRVALLLRDAEREAVGTVDDRTREYLARTVSS